MIKMGVEYFEHRPPCVRVNVDFFQTNSSSYLFLSAPPLNYRVHPLQLTMIYYPNLSLQRNQSKSKKLFMRERCFSVWKQCIEKGKILNIFEVLLMNNFVRFGQMQITNFTFSL